MSFMIHNEGVKVSKWKRDSLVQAWIDRRDLATCSIALKALGVHPRSPSEVIATILRMLAQQQETQVESTQEAIEILNSLGIEGQLNPSGRGIGNLRKNLLNDQDDADLERMAERIMKEKGIS